MCSMKDEDAKTVRQYCKVQYKDARWVLTGVKQSIKSKGCLQGTEVMIINICPSCQEAGSARPAGLASRAMQRLIKLRNIPAEELNYKMSNF